MSNILNEFSLNKFDFTVYIREQVLMLIFNCSYCWTAYLHAETQLGGYGIFQISRLSRLGGILNGRIGQTEQD